MGARRKLAGTLGGLAVLVAAVAGCRDPLQAPLPVAVQVLALRREVLRCGTRFTATVREKQRIELSFKVPGTLAAVRQVPGPQGKDRDVQEGDEVTAAASQPLLRLDDADYRRRLEMSRQQLAQAQAKRRALEATATAIRANFQRMQALRERGSIAVQAFDDIQARRDASEAELEAVAREISAAMLAQQQAEDDLNHCELRLPIPRATISRKQVERGERVQGGQPVLEVMDLSAVRVAFGVPDTQVSQFRPGQVLAVLADAFAGQQFLGRVSKILPAADLRTRTFEIEVTLDEPRGLRPGMVVTLETGQQQEMLLVPMTAIVRGRSPDEPTVFAVVEEGGQKVVRKRRVALDGVYDNRIRLLEQEPSQLRQGDVIVVRGAFRLCEGQAVRVLDTQDEILPVGL